MRNMFSVLVIEDPYSTRKASNRLRQAGCYVLTASSCTEALDKMPEYVDAVVIDSDTPNLCTRSSLSNLKERAPRTAVVVLAGENKFAMLRNLKGADGFLSMPCNTPQLLDTLRQGFLNSPKGRSAADRAALLVGARPHMDSPAPMHA
ncbi:DNA-binding NtrC family response regulator [Desulfobaculum xiamenense]|uniref:DNA-binding NtrC family response regulator n=1 Tax=Desulfobaculum xiamenense TaxID=995050 RepID=A0A846QJ53_9BACT|nr:response regulator [Desulfobaculum xiamenense]NJB66502.1 DNA-binding NtrC family response regulator [Desulfobaculum xiamenense]